MKHLIGSKVLVKFKDFEFSLVGELISVNVHDIFTIEVVYQGSKVAVFRTMKELNFVL